MSTHVEVWQPASYMISTQVGHEGVLLDLNSKDYYSVNNTGMVIWELLTEKKSLAEIAELLHAQFQVSPEDARMSTNRFVHSLASNGLVEVCPDLQTEWGFTNLDLQEGGEKT